MVTQQTIILQTTNYKRKKENGIEEVEMQQKKNPKLKRYRTTWI